MQDCLVPVIQGENIKLDQNEKPEVTNESIGTVAGEISAIPYKINEWADIVSTTQIRQVFFWKSSILKKRVR